MQATVSLANGKELDLEVGTKGVTKLFVADGCLVVVYGDKILKFGNTPFVLEYARKKDKKEDIEDDE